MSELRQTAESLTKDGVSEREACRLLSLQRSSFRYEEHPRSNPVDLRPTIRKLAMRHRRYGYRRITVELERCGIRRDPKTVWQLWKAEGLSLPRKRPRRRPQTGFVDRPMPATRPNQVWSYDFIFDRMLNREFLKMLVVIDEYSRECLAIRVRERVSSQDVREILEELVAERGAPEYVRSDNGPEFIAEQLRGWLLSNGIRPLFIEPGHPWQNGFVESFNGKFRDECLNMELFFSREEAQLVVDHWRRIYNEERPHMSLGYRTPQEVGENYGEDEEKTVSKGVEKIGLGAPD